MDTYEFLQRAVDREAVVDVTVQLPRRQAYALAELCKRLTWYDAERLAVDRDETERMIAATDALRAALERAGVYVR